MRLKGILCLSFGLALQAAFAAETELGPLKINDCGILTANDVKVAVIHFGKDYKNVTTQHQGVVKAAADFPKREGNVWTLNGSFETKEGVFTIAETVERKDDSAFTLNVEVKADTPVPTGELAVVFNFPVDKFAGRSFTIDGVKTLFPVESKDVRLAGEGAFKSFLVPCEKFKLELSGGNGILVQDDRKYESKDYSARIGFTPRSGELSSAKIALEMKFIPYDSKPLDLSSAMNMGFKDDIAGDGKGGWTDQGPDNDLRIMKPGLQSLGSVKFKVVDPEKNKGVSCIVLGQKGSALPGKASAGINNETMKNLCLLHAIAWSPNGRERIGTVNVSYADGSLKSFPVVNGVDVGNWWCPVSAENGQVVWTGENASSYVGLCLSTFPLEPKPVAKIEFAGEGNSIWMIVAASASSEDIPKTSSVPCYIVANADWQPFSLPSLVEKGSALDFSGIGLLDAPAGKHGRVIAKDGHFAFEDNPSKPARFYGTNIYFSICFPEKAEAERLASMIASCGYNSVRFHHFDEYLVDRKDKARTTLDQAKMDKFHYLLKCLKDKGVYVTIDLFTIRVFNDVKFGDSKQRILFTEEGMENLLQFAKNLLTDVNPYTGLAWKDDPAIAFISCVNEDPILWWKPLEKTPKTPGETILRDAFHAWLKEKGLDQVEGKERSLLENKFIYEAQVKAFERISSFLRGIGVKAPLTDQNNISVAEATLSREVYDYVDNHSYWAHPSFVERKWSLPMRFEQGSSLNRMAVDLSHMFPSRLFGKPFTVTEFNYCFPNRYRAEGGALMGTYASLQDWSALYRFGYIGSVKQFNDGPGEVFDGVNDAMQLMSDRLGTLLFLRGDVQASSLKMPVYTSRSLLDSKTTGLTFYPSIDQKLGLVGQVGSVVGDDPKAPLQAVSSESDAETLKKVEAVYKFDKGELDLTRKFARSSTGEIEISGSEGYMKIATPRTCAVLTLKDAKLSSGVLTVDNKKDFACVSVSSLDGKPVADAKRLLVFHLTNSFNTMTKFRDQSLTILEAYGHLPHLARRGVADLSIKLAPGVEPKVYAIDLGGKRLGEMKSSFSEGTLAFTADTFALKTPCFAYEIVR